MALPASFNTSNFSVSGYTPDLGPVGSASSTSTSSPKVGSSAFAYSQIASGLISAWGTYAVGKIQANAIQQMSIIQNKRLANKQAFEMWTLNEKSAQERSAQVQQSLDSKVLALQRTEAVRAQQATDGSRGGTSQRILTELEAQEEREQQAIAEQGATLTREQAIRQGRLQLDVIGRRDTTIPEQPSSALAITQGLTNALKVGIDIRGG